MYIINNSNNNNNNNNILNRVYISMNIPTRAQPVTCKLGLTAGSVFSRHVKFSADSLSLNPAKAILSHQSPDWWERIVMLRALIQIHLSTVFATIQEPRRVTQ